MVQYVLEPEEMSEDLYSLRELRRERKKNLPLLYRVVVFSIMDEKMSMTLRGWIQTKYKGGRALKTSKIFTKRWLKGNINVWKCFEEESAMEWGKMVMVEYGVMVLN